MLQPPRNEQAHSDFMIRDMESIPRSGGTDGFRFTIMSYNLLAQHLVQRRLYPFSGSILKWKTRFPILQLEIKHYNPSIICLQEVDVDQLVHWDTFFRKNQYRLCTYEQPGKSHCVAIAYKTQFFALEDHFGETFDNVTPPELNYEETNNGFLVAKFHYTKEAIEAHAHLKDKGLVVSTTHLFWRPDACYERARQYYVLLESISSYVEKIAIDSSGIVYSAIMAGDFNSEPFDAPYLLATTKAHADNESVRDKLIQSVISRKSDSLENPDCEKTAELRSVAETNANTLINIHKQLNYRAQSLYGLAYHLIRGKEAKFGNEPAFSNWTPAFKGMLDYIFILSKCEGLEPYSEVDMFQFETAHKIKLLKLLPLPTEDEMGVAGLPHLRWSPSDHISIMAELEVPGDEIDSLVADLGL